MTLELFISILVISATATSVAIEIIKTLLNNFGITYKTTLLAMVIAFIVGIAEVLIYSYVNNVKFSVLIIIYSCSMGIANAVGSNVGYDKIKDLLCTLFKKV